VPAARVALKITEGPGHVVEFTFFTVPSGSLVWMSREGTPFLLEGTPAVCPDLVGSNFRMRITDAKLPIGRACGCLLPYLDLPEMVFSFKVARSPYPIVSIRCLEMSALPLEWFYRPLFNGEHMRTLLVRCFQQDLHFMGDEIHFHMAFQMPKLGAVLRRVLKAFSAMIVGAIFSPPGKDPVPTLLSAFARDCAVLEASIPAKHN